MKTRIGKVGHGGFPRNVDANGKGGSDLLAKTQRAAKFLGSTPALARHNMILASWSVGN